VPASKVVSAADAANRIGQFGAASLGFDAEGQTTSKVDALGTSVYQWDSRGRLTQVTLPSGQLVTYGYDALGRRVSRVANGVTTTFQYDGEDIVIDRVSGGIAIDYLNGPAVDDILRQTGGTFGTLYYLQNHQGSVTALTNVGGAVIEQQQYESFGASAGSVRTRYGYTGRERDELTGLIYYRARWLDPSQGRFLSEDPIGFSDSINLYSYVDDDPINYTDPYGLAKNWSDAQCKKLLNDIISRTNRIMRRWARSKAAGFVDRGGKKHKYGITKPGGHNNTFKQERTKLIEELVDYIDNCLDDCDPPPPPLRDAIDAAKLQIPERNASPEKNRVPTTQPPHPHVPETDSRWPKLPIWDPAFVNGMPPPEVVAAAGLTILFFLIFKVPVPVVP